MPVQRSGPIGGGLCLHLRRSLHQPEHPHTNATPMPRVPYSRFSRHLCPLAATAHGRSKQNQSFVLFVFYSSFAIVLNIAQYPDDLERIKVPKRISDCLMAGRKEAKIIKGESGGKGPIGLGAEEQLQGGVDPRLGLTCNRPPIRLDGD